METGKKVPLAEGVGEYVFDELRFAVVLLSVFALLAVALVAGRGGCMATSSRSCIPT